MRFTDSPFEKMMKQKPRPQAPSPAKPPRGSRCSGCPYWRGIGCVSCYRELMRARRGIGCVSCYRELMRAPAGGR